MATKNQQKSAPANSKGAVQTSPKKAEVPEGEEVVFGWSNYKWMLAGVLTIVLGFVLMAGGGSDVPGEFNYEEIFSWRRIGLAPMVVLAGFGLVGYSIMKKSKK
ncbi:MAG: DUF3098 domain-containing protein [Tidjanibacter sp.]|nr:DUF3098 domain-containing protein [Tidjanibacter sp.]MBR3681863.1 DUF3098 domain-containing protein [Tidjanibacter sp.]MBR3853053.1 DUF3098 domain-containing protein [Tidjanibacter sp.]